MDSVNSILQSLPTDWDSLLGVLQQNGWYIAGATIAGYVLLRWLRAPRNLPPGPRGLPFLGAVSDVSEKLHEDGVRLSKKYNSDIIYVNVMGMKMVLLNSMDVIKEATTKHGDDFSNRPMYPESTWGGFIDDLFLSPFDHTWIENKKFAVTTLKTYGFGSKVGEEKVLDEFGKLTSAINAFQGKPQQIRTLLKEVGACLIFNMLLGKCFDYKDKELQEIMEKEQEWLNSLLDHSIMAADMLPGWMAKLFFSKALERRTKSVINFGKAIQKVVEEHMEEFDPNNPRDVIDGYLKERKVTAKKMASNLLAFSGDAIDSFSSTLYTAIFYMAKYPEVQKRAQKQLDDVIGSSGQVTMKDKPSLPVIDAIIHETFRILSVAAILPPHEAVKDLTFRGYTIPKGAMIFYNAYSVHYNEKVYENPSQFNVENFLASDGTFKYNTDFIPFGMGRRMCLGKPLVMMEIFLLVSNLLLRYDIRFPEGFTPQDDTDFGSNGMARETKLFEVIFKERL